MSAAAPRTRADAVRNFERVLAAATEVLAEKGAEAGVPEIAARAGVGKGTVYRCFPTKEHLIAAVLAGSVVAAGLPTDEGYRAAFLVGAGVALAAAVTATLIPSRRGRMVQAVPAAEAA